MINIQSLNNKATKEGYSGDMIEAKVCQDIILILFSKSKFKRNITIKGGVVMRSISKDVRRATIDIDLDLIKFPLTIRGVKVIIKELNNISNIKIKIIGKIEELKHQDYKGKRVFVEIKDSYKNSLRSKIDIGVHKHLNLIQNEYCFDVDASDKGVTLLINSYEQMFTEKVKSLLRFGSLSTRYKDVYDLYFLIKLLNRKKLINCFNILIFEDAKIKEKDMRGVYIRLKKTFEDKNYLKGLSTSDKNWLNIDNKIVLRKILNYIDSYS